METWERNIDEAVNRESTLKRRFAKLPTDLARNPDVSLSAKGLYGILRSFDGPRGAYPSIAKLAELSGRKPRTVSRYLRELVDAKWISVERRGLGKTNVYAFD